MIRNGIMGTVSNNVQVRPTLWLVVGACLALGLLSCGGGKQSGGSLSIAFATAPLAPPTSLGLGTVGSFAAVVTGDPGSQGVNWTVACTPGIAPGSTCGTITAHTATGYPATYTTPAGTSNLAGSIPVGGTVTVTAASTADPSKSVTATIAITQQPPVSIAFNTAPPLSMLTGATAKVIAYVGNDSTAAGADLSLSCGSTVAGACGLIIPAHTNGTIGGAAVYTAPLAIPPDGGVTITAVATATETQSAPVTVRQLSPSRKRSSRLRCRSLLLQIYPPALLQIS